MEIGGLSDAQSIDHLYSIATPAAFFRALFLYLRFILKVLIFKA